LVLDVYNADGGKMKDGSGRETIIIFILSFTTPYSQILMGFNVFYHRIRDDANQNPNANVHFGGVSGDKFANESESRILALFAEHRQRRIPTTSRAADYGP